MHNTSNTAMKKNMHVSQHQNLIIILFHYIIIQPWSVMETGKLFPWYWQGNFY